MLWLFQADVLLRLALLLTAVGGGLLVIGARGRRVNLNLCCRGCGFDLQGSVDRVRGESTWTCPECGEDLTGKDVLRLGERRRISALVLIGLLLLSIPTVGCATAIWAQVTRFDWNTAKPMWVLQEELIEPVPSLEDTGSDLFQTDHVTLSSLMLPELLPPTRRFRSVTLDELHRRAKSQDIDRSEGVELMAMLLGFQADDGLYWHQEAGRLIEHGRSVGWVNDEQWQRYVDQSLQFRAAFLRNDEPAVRRHLGYVGASTPWSLVIQSVRSPKLGGMSRQRAMVHFESVHISGERMEDDPLPSRDDNADPSDKRQPADKAQPSDMDLPTKDTDTSRAKGFDHLRVTIQESDDQTMATQWAKQIFVGVNALSPGRYRMTATIMIRVPDPSYSPTTPLTDTPRPTPDGSPEWPGFTNSTPKQINLPPHLLTFRRRAIPLTDTEADEE